MTLCVHFFGGRSIVSKANATPLRYGRMLHPRLLPTLEIYHCQNENCCPSYLGLVHRRQRCFNTGIGKARYAAQRYHLNNPGECRSEWYSDQPDYQSGLQMPQLFEKIRSKDRCARKNTLRLGSGIG